MRNAAYDRAMILQQQGRWDDAERELRQLLASEPNNGHAHAMLSLCLANQEKLTPATDEARQAIVLAPDLPLAHYALANALLQRNYYTQAKAAIDEAIRLDSWDADYFSMLSAIHHDQRRWRDALDAAEAGLKIDPEHVGCTNFRAIAMVKLGHRNEAGATIQAALRRDPDSALTHANMGWTLLHDGDAKRALEHFREALRIDPQLEWARAGIVEALKSRNIIYRWMLRYFLWTSTLSPRAQWGIVIGGFILARILRAAERNNPDFAPITTPLLALYFIFCVMTWISIPLFNLLLRINRFGRYALSREQTVASNWFGAVVGGAIICGIAAIILRTEMTFLATVYFMALIIPVAAVFACSEGWPRKAMGMYTIAMAILGLIALTGFMLSTANSFGDAPALIKFVGGLFLLGALLSNWIANALIMTTPKK